MKTIKKTTTSSKSNTAITSRRHEPTTRSEKDDKNYARSDFDNDDYKGKNYKDEDDYNSGKLGRGAEASGDEGLKNIPRRKYKKVKPLRKNRTAPY